MPGLKARAFCLITAFAPRTPKRDAEPWEVRATQALSAHDIPGGPRLTRVIVLAVLCSLAAVQVIQQFTKKFPPHGFRLGFAITAILMLLALVISVTFAAAERWPLWRRLVTLLAAGLITYLPVTAFGEVWGGMTGYFAGLALILLYGWLAWILFAGAIGSMILIPMMWNFGAYYAADLACSSVALGIVIFGLARLSLIIRQVDAMSGELAHFAVINERMRFARDLHDLLGYSLSAITLKAEFTRRLLSSNPGRARDELAEVLDIARQALADVRAVANGYRSISLAKEAHPVASLLAAAGISAQVDITCGVLDENVDIVLATILREAVTNMLRHSTARNCTIEAGVVGETVRLLVTNDGVPNSAASDRRGSGLQNLSARLAAIGGQLTAQVNEDWFSVLAEAPLVPPVRHDRRPGAGARRRNRA